MVIFELVFDFELFENVVVTSRINLNFFLKGREVFISSIEITYDFLK